MPAERFFPPFPAFFAVFGLDAVYHGSREFMFPQEPVVQFYHVGAVAPAYGAVAVVTVFLEIKSEIFRELFRYFLVNHHNLESSVFSICDAALPETGLDLMSRYVLTASASATGSLLSSLYIIPVSVMRIFL